LQVYLSGSSSPVVDVTISSTSYSVALDEGVYNWRVTAIDGAGNYASWTAFLTLNVDRTAPSPPELYTPSNNEVTTNSQPPFSWSIIADAEYYQIQISYVDDFTMNLIDTTVTSTTFKPSNPLPDGVWYWHVRAVDHAGNVGDWSVSFVLTVDTHGPPAPSIVSPEDSALLNTSSINFDWTDSPEAVGYQILVSTDSDFTSAVINTTTTSSSYSATLDDGTYYFKVRAYDALNNLGEWSDICTFTIDTSPPEVPTITYPFDGIATNDNTTTITWGAVSDAVEYRLRIFEEGANSPFVDIIIAGQTQYTTSELNDGVYEIHLSAKDAAGNWSSETVVSYTIDTLPPADVTLSDPNNDTLITTSSPILNWNKIDDAMKYEIQLSIYADFHIRNSYMTTGTLYHVYNLEDNRWYWRVRAVDSANNYGNWSEVWTFVIDAVPPSVPQPISPSNDETISDPMPTFSWQESDTAVSYQLQVSKSSGFGTDDIIIDITTNDTSYTSTVFLSDAVYYYRIRACDEWDIWSDWSLVVRFTVNYQPLSGPELIDPADGSFLNQSPVTFTWQSVSGAVSYEIQLDINSYFSHPFSDALVNDATYTFTGALPNSVVYWRVRAYDQYNIPGLWSTVYAFTFDNVAPAKPSLISPTNDSDISSVPVEFQWSSVFGASKYELIIYNAETREIIYQSEITTNSVTVSLADGYFGWKVRAIDSAGNTSEWSDTWYFELDATAPEVIASHQELTIEYGTAGQTIYWNISDAHLYSYKVYLGQSVIEEGYISEPTTITVNISEEWSPALYPFKIEVQDTFGNIATSEINVIIEDTTAPVIENVTYTPTEPDSDDTITIEAHVTDLDFVHVYLMYRVNGGEYIEIEMSRDASDYSAQIGPFEGEDTIDFYIKAVDQSGNTAESSVQTFTVQMIITTSTETTTTVTTTTESTSEESPIAFVYVLVSFAMIGLAFRIYRRRKH
ncbi:MAG: Ig-like domain-containing protein, partial [Candidatus Heimdallarchaeaceae archaeon]